MIVEISTGNITVRSPMMEHKTLYRAAVKNALRQEKGSNEESLAMIEVEETAANIARLLCDTPLDSMEVDDANTVINAVIETINGVRNRDFTNASGKQQT